mmetsp:Transcript_19350/g.50414  ORF Transcript_19350/g.50414 Transcript_19350/m.50414 type:complete len:259 (+) Transcript_19350:358-1134(+)
MISSPCGALSLRLGSGPKFGRMIELRTMSGRPVFGALVDSFVEVGQPAGVCTRSGGLSLARSASREACLDAFLAVSSAPTLAAAAASAAYKTERIQASARNQALSHCLLTNEKSGSSSPKKCCKARLLKSGTSRASTDRTAATSASAPYLSTNFTKWGQVNSSNGTSRTASKSRPAPARASAVGGESILARASTSFRLKRCDASWADSAPVAAWAQPFDELGSKATARVPVVEGLLRRLVLLCGSSRWGRHLLKASAA